MYYPSSRVLRQNSNVRQVSIICRYPLVSLPCTLMKMLECFLLYLNIYLLSFCIILRIAYPVSKTQVMLGLRLRCVLLAG